VRVGLCEKADWRMCGSADVASVLLLGLALWLELRLGMWLGSVIWLGGGLN